MDNSALICHSTEVTFTRSSAPIDSEIICVKTDDHTVDIVTEKTSFHPVSHIWPDHPADKGYVECDGQTAVVTDCLTGAIELATGTLYVAQDIPVKRDTEGWVFVVVHRIKDGLIDLQPRQKLRLVVDETYQWQLSLAHSAEHLTSLALNKVLTEQGYWRKDADRKDSLNHYDFHSYAQESSSIEPLCARVGYRLGKTLRKRGFNSVDFLSQLTLIEQSVNHQLESWVELNHDIKLICSGTHLIDSRYWECDLGSDGVATIPCGGTHARSLSDYSSIRVNIKHSGDQNIEIHTVVTE